MFTVYTVHSGFTKGAKHPFGIPLVEKFACAEGFLLWACLCREALVHPLLKPPHGHFFQFILGLIMLTDAFGVRVNRCSNAGVCFMRCKNWLLNSAELM